MEDKLQKLEQILNVLDKDTVTQEEFILSFEKVLDFVKEARDLTEEEMVKIREMFIASVADIKQTTTKEVERLKENITSSINQELERLQAKANEKIEEIVIKAELIQEAKTIDEDRIVNEVLAKVPPPQDLSFIETKIKEVEDKIVPFDNKRLDDIERMAKVNSMPVTTSFINGKRAKNLNFTGASVTYQDDTATVSITSSGGTPGGSDTQLQYNNAGAFGGISGATTDGTAVTFATDGLLVSNIKASGSGGLLLESNSGTDVALLGAGGGAGATFYGGVNIGNTTTAGTATTAFSPTMSGSSAVSNFLNITGTMPSSTSAIARAIHLSITSQGSSSNSQYLMNMSLGAGYTGSSTTAGINLANLAAGTGTAFWTNGSYNVGIYSSGSGTTAGHNVGFAGNASASSTLNVGVYGRSTSSTNSPTLNIGNVALATGATYNIGAFFGLFSAAPTITQSAVVMADNGSTGSDIFVARANGTATAKIDGTGNLIWAIDNTYDIGASGATRPRTGYFGTSLVAPTINGTSAIQLNGTSINTAGTLSNVAYLNQANTFSANTQTFQGATNSNVTFDYKNTDTGASANTLFRIWTGANDSLVFRVYSATHATNANEAEFDANRAGALTFKSSDASGYLRFMTGGSNERMRILSGGNVGIGTTSPAEKLDVVGKIKTSGGVLERVVTTTDDATAVIDVAVTDTYELSAISNNTTFSTTGTPTDGQKIMIRWKDAGVSKTLTWDAIFVAIGVTLPTATTAGKWQYVGCQYNSGAAKFHVLAVGTQA